MSLVANSNMSSSDKLSVFACMADKSQLTKFILSIIKLNGRDRTIYQREAIEALSSPDDNSFLLASIYPLLKGESYSELGLLIMTAIETQSCDNNNIATQADEFICLFDESKHDELIALAVNALKD